jgi:hypothetical protein
MKQVSKAIGRKRMLKMADFLDKLPSEKFDFTIAYGKETPSLIKGCGSAGCIIGWTPRVFPRLVKYNPIATWQLHRVDPYFKIGDESKLSYREVGEAVFGLSADHAFNLFTPGTQCYFYLKNLDHDATPKQAAKLLRNYVKKYMSE